MFGVAMVRNEADIIECFVRHNLSHLDALAIVDHASDDGTCDILRALVAEGFPIRLGVYDHPAHHQQEILTRLAREAFAQGADYVFPLDADEFLKVPSRSNLERALHFVPAPLSAAIQWQTYVPGAVEQSAFRPADYRDRRVREPDGFHKVVLTRHFRDATDAIIGPGSHTVLMKGPGQDTRRDPVRLARISPKTAALAHFPVRSTEQLIRKILLGWAAHRAAARSNPSLAFHWRELRDELVANGEPSVKRIREIALNYGLPMADWLPAAGIATIDDPLPDMPPARYAHLAKRTSRPAT